LVVLVVPAVKAVTVALPVLVVLVVPAALVV